MQGLTFHQTRFGLMMHRANEKVLGRALELYGQWALDEIALISELLSLHSGGAFIDVGANVGTHSLAIARIFPNIDVYAYDAQHFAARMFSTNMSLNNIYNVKLNNLAVGEDCRFADLFTNDAQTESNAGAAQFRQDSKPGDTRIVLPQVSLDSMHRDDVISFIKIDIEGGEAACIRGASKLIERCRPIVYFENNEVTNKGEIFDFFSSLGYRTFWHINEPFDPGNFKGSDHTIYGGSGEVNILCVHPESAAATFVESCLTPTDQALDDIAWYATRNLNTELKSKMPAFSATAVDRFCARLADITLNEERFGSALQDAFMLEQFPAFSEIRANPLFGAVEHKAKPLLTSLLLQRQFDEARYLALYPDVAEAVIVGQFGSGALHFAQQGYFEGRVG